ncbi:uncharacterized protein isoform X2 [Rhodnius prolixus]|uniref:Putative conserved plasma membrane protein rhodnius neglectus n=2 Tax=Rhodnius TaxID=13248 RepID=A0A4P6D7J1_RHOPR
MILGYFINNAIISVDQIGVVPWSLFLWMIWLILHTVYKKCFQMLLQKIKVDENDQQRLVKIYWSLVFTAITIPFALQNLSLNPQDIKERFKSILENNVYSWYNNNNNPSIQMKLSYVLLTGFYLNNVCEISIEKGFKNIDFFHSELLTIFFVSTFPTRCVLYGIAVTCLVNVVRCLLEFCKFLACISSIVRSKLLRQLALIMLIVHSIIWSIVFFHILPKYFLFLAIRKLKQKNDATYISVFSLLNLSLWGFYLIEIYKSPISNIITNYVYGKKNNFDDILFSSNNKVNEEFEPQDIDFIEPLPCSISSKDTKGQESRKSKENLLALYQTVKCVIRVKRRLKRIREKLRASHASSDSKDSKNVISSCSSN